MRPAQRKRPKFMTADKRSKMFLRVRMTTAMPAQGQTLFSVSHPRTGRFSFDVALDPGRSGHLKVWVPRGESVFLNSIFVLIQQTDVSDHQAFLKDKMLICQRFATDILIPIGQVYKVTSTIHGVIDALIWAYSFPWTFSTSFGIMKAH